MKEQPKEPKEPKESDELKYLMARYRDIYLKFFPKEESKRVLEFLNGDKFNEKTVSIINDNALDLYSVTKDKSVFDILKISNELRSVFRKMEEV